MPKVKQIEKLKHPNSRKTKAVLKQINKKNNREKKYSKCFMRNTVLAEKIKWFQDRINKESNKCTPNEIRTLIFDYLNRFNDELEQINIKNAIGFRKNNRQHASRESVIKLTVEKEIEEYKTCGLELPNLLDPVQFKLLKEWNGELKFLQKFQLKNFSEKFLTENMTVT